MKKKVAWNKHKCIDCGKMTGSKPLYLDGKLVGYRCESCDWEIL